MSQPSEPNLVASLVTVFLGSVVVLFVLDVVLSVPLHLGVLGVGAAVITAIYYYLVKGKPDAS